MSYFIMVLGCIAIVAIVAFAVDRHTKRVQEEMTKRAEAQNRAYVEMLRLTAGTKTGVSISIEVGAKNYNEEKVADASSALTGLASAVPGLMPNFSKGAQTSMPRRTKSSGIRRAARQAKQQNSRVSI